MPRLIDADKTIGLLKTRLYETALNNATTVCDASYLYTECADNRIEAWINELPTVDAESLNAKHEEIGYEKGYCDGYAEALEVTDGTERHGHWIWMGEQGDSRYMCSVCKSKEDVPTCNGEPTVWEYCPNCGAKMDEVREDE